MFSRDRLSEGFEQLVLAVEDWILEKYLENVLRDILRSKGNCSLADRVECLKTLSPIIIGIDNV